MAMGMVSLPKNGGNFKNSYNRFTDKNRKPARFVFGKVVVAIYGFSCTGGWGFHSIVWLYLKRSSLLFWLVRMVKTKKFGFYEDFVFFVNRYALVLKVSVLKN